MKKTLCLAMLLLLTCSGNALTLQAAASNCRILDVDGNAVANAGVTIWNFRDRKLTTSDSVGQFSTDVQFPAGGFVIVECSGFDLGGTTIETGETMPTKILLYRTGTSPPMVTRTLEMTAAERNALAAEMIEQAWQQLEQSPNDMQQRMSLFRSMSRLDPGRVLEFVQQHPMGAMYDAGAYQLIQHHLAKIDPDAAIEVNAMIEEPFQRANAMAGLLACRLLSEERRLTLESEAIAAAKAVRDPAQRVASAGLVAEQIRRAGFPERARPLIAEFLPLADSLPTEGWPAFARSLLAAEVAGDDVDLALKMVEGNGNQNESVRALGRIAFAIAESNPVGAGKALRNIQQSPDDLSINRYASHARICALMARSDPEMAALIARETIPEPGQLAWALALIAGEMPNPDRTVAIGMLHTAVNSLLDSDQTNRSDDMQNEDLLGAMLPIAEGIDPRLVRPMIWQVILSTSLQNKWTTRGQSGRGRGFRAAATIGRYDPLAGRLILEQAGTRVPANFIAEYFTAVLSCSPGTFKKESVDFRAACDDSSIIVRATRASFNALAADDEDFWQLISKPVYLQWVGEEFEHPLDD